MRIIVKNLPHFITENEIKTHFSSQGEITDCFIPKDENGKSRRFCFIGYKNEKSCIGALEKLNGIYLFNHKINVSLCKNNKENNITESEERITLYYSKLFVMYLPKVDLKILREELEKYGEIKFINFIEQPLHFNCELIFKNPEDSLNFLKNVNEILGKNILIKPNKDNQNESKSKIDYYNSLFFNFESIVNKSCENYKIKIDSLVDLKDKDLGSKIALLETNLVNQTNKFLIKNKIDFKSKEKNKKILIVRNTEIEKCLDFMNVKCRIEVAPSKTLALLKFKTEEDAYKCYRNINLRRYNESVVYCEYAPVWEGGREDREGECGVEGRDEGGREGSEGREGDKESKDEGKDRERVKDDNKDKTINNNPTTPYLKFTNKLLIKNLPFQATKSDVQRLFKGKFNFTNIRIPKKRDGNSRGFCFVELDSEKKVIEAIEYFGMSTHLYGRRLVLEKAKE